MLPLHQCIQSYTFIKLVHFSGFIERNHLTYSLLVLSLLFMSIQECCL